MDRSAARIVIQNQFTDIKSFYKPESLTYLLGHYGEEQRAYHNEIHIAEMFSLLDMIQNKASEPRNIQHAILWHDASYRTQDENGAYLPDSINVNNSVKALRYHANDKFSAIDLDATAAIIQATDGHRLPINDKGYYPGFKNDVGLFLDLDLFQFAKPWNEFEQNSQDIRQEFSWVEDKRFYLARASILETFAARETLYHVVPMRKQWEKQARSNLNRSIKELRAQALDL